MTLCLHLTRRPDHNTAAAPCHPAVNNNEIRVMSMCCCPRCSLDPDTPERNSSCLVSCYLENKFVSRVRGTNHPCLVGLLIVRTCAAPFSEEFTGVSLFPMFSLPSAVLGTILDIFLRRVDPPRATDEEGKIPALGANRLHATELKKEIPGKKIRPALSNSVRGQDDLSENCPPSVTTRTPSSIGGVDVGVRIPLCGYGLMRRIPVGARRLNQSWTTGMKGVLPIRKIIQSCAVGAPGSEGMILIRRVNRSCTTKWGGKHEDPILIGLLSRPESRCPERDTTEGIRMPPDASESGARKGRNRCAEMESLSVSLMDSGRGRIVTIGIVLPTSYLLGTVVVTGALLLL